MTSPATPPSMTSYDEALRRTADRTASLRQGAQRIIGDWLDGEPLVRVSEPPGPPARLSIAPQAGPLSVLVAEDERELSHLLALSLRADGAVVRTAPRVAAALAALADPVDVDVLVVDLDLVDGVGIEVVEHARARHPDVGVVVISGAVRERLDEVGVKLGAAACLQKPFTTDSLVAAVRRAAPKRASAAR